MKKILPILVFGILVLSGIGAGAIVTYKVYDEIKSEKKSIFVSEPIIKDISEYVSVDLTEKTTYLLEVGKPKIPVVTEVFTFPFGTKINSVDVSFSKTNTIVLAKEVQPVDEPIPVSAGLQMDSEQVKDVKIYEIKDLYPTNSYSYITGSGLQNGERVLFLAVKCYFIRYSPIQNIIYYSKSADITVSYQEPINPVNFNDVYDMVIITPSAYSNELQPLINHKNNYGIETTLKTTEDIYNEYDAFDEAEEIKYFIKDAIENWNISNVLLVGSIDKLPIRTTYATTWGEGDVLTDLYYADIYDEFGEFCDWDGNNNGRFGEVYNNHHQTYDLDGVDLFPDVNLGRLACMDDKEVDIVVDKIIQYETGTFGKTWFNNIVLCGGDTFPFRNGNEGEIINNIVEGIMSDFTPTKLWTSDNTFKASNLNKAINSGAGFVDYSGHGYNNRIGTHPPNDNRWVMYYEINLLGLFNGYKLPIVYFDACLTSKLDYNSSEKNVNGPARVMNSFLIDQFLKPFTKMLSIIFNVDKSEFVSKIMDSYISQYEPRDSPTLLSCFSWSWVAKKNGGAIATIGATRTAYGGVDDGAGKIAIEFFKGYESSENLGQMMTYSQNEYIIDVQNDFLTIEEFILLGDPSLKIGGYETKNKSNFP
ncbi:hypothetical protein AYK24_00970 [Thermoplasmatales archaeon SG8-52-4]|nr:MAG: hypothetical protein AYK24_00970 [Thermoplasmatales archaeon SG8-52-4]